MKGQLSAEMLILIALVLGLIFIVYTQLSKTVTDTSKAVDTRAGDILTASGGCTDDDNCTKVLGKGATCDTATGMCSKPTP